jgi:hypothetical protein
MSQSSSDKFLYFTVGLLKGSEALEALRQDAVKHHMIDHPGQLIALRLTEYYESESLNQGHIQVTPGLQEQIPQTAANTNPNVGITNHTPPARTTPAVSHGEVEIKPRYEQRLAERNSATEWRAPNPASIPSAATSFEVTPQVAPTHMQQPVSYNPASQMTGRMRALMRDGENVVSTSSNADLNADEAADYWSTL